MIKKPSLLDRLTGSTGDDYDDFFEDQVRDTRTTTPPRTPERPGTPQERRDERLKTDWATPQEHEELPVDVYQSNGHVVLKAFIAGISPNTIDIALTRDMVTITGTREDEKEVTEDGYFQKELYWGSFSRTVLLPEEVDVDGAEASEKHGVLVIRLPKINKAKQTKLKVRTK